MDWFHLAQDSGSCEHGTKLLRVPWNARNFLTSSITSNFLRKTPLCAVNLPHKISYVLCPVYSNFYWGKWKVSRSQWPRGLRRRSAAARLLRSWVRIPPGAWMFVCGECCVLSGTGLCDELITLPEESYRLWCVVVCDQETSRMRRPWPALGRSTTKKKLKSRLYKASIDLNYLNWKHFFRFII